MYNVDDCGLKYKIQVLKKKIYYIFNNILHTLTLYFHRIVDTSTKKYFKI